jgi:hypothetical protein
MCVASTKLYRLTTSTLAVGDYIIRKAISRSCKVIGTEEGTKKVYEENRQEDIDENVIREKRDDDESWQAYVTSAVLRNAGQRRNEPNDADGSEA